MPNQQITWKAYLTAFLLFISSRLILLLAVAFSARFIPKKSGSEYWNVGPSWNTYLLRYDSGWYLRIAVEGYTYNGNDFIQQPVVFHPLYPLISQIFSKILYIDQTIALLVVSNLSIAIAVLLIFKLVNDEYGYEIALNVIMLLSFFPTSLFFSAGYTESLALLLITGFFLLLKVEHHLPAALCAGLATAARSTGIVLLPILLWAIWGRFLKQHKRVTIYTFIYTALAILLATSGLWSYMIYLWIKFNQPWAFMTAQRAWHGNDVGGDFFKVLTLQPFYHLGDILRLGLETYTLDPWFFLLFLVLICLFGRILSIPYQIYALGVLLLPYFTLSGRSGFKSFTRYIILAFPAFIIIGHILKNQHWIRLIIGIFLAIMLFTYTAMFAQWYWAG